MCYTNTHTHMCMYVIELNYDWRRIYVYVDIFETITIQKNYQQQWRLSQILS